VSDHQRIEAALDTVIARGNSFTVDDVLEVVDSMGGIDKANFRYVGTAIVRAKGAGRIRKAACSACGEAQTVPSTRNHARPQPLWLVGEEPRGDSIAEDIMARIKANRTAVRLSRVHRLNRGERIDELDPEPQTTGAALGALHSLLLLGVPRGGE